MAYSELLAERIRNLLSRKKIVCTEKKMFGGICFLLNDKMLAGIVDEKLMARIDPGVYTDALEKPGCHEMDFSGKPMKGFVYVYPKGIITDNLLLEWLELCLDYNPKAKSSKKK